MKNIYKPLPTIKIKSEPEKAMEKIAKRQNKKRPYSLADENKPEEKND